MLQVYKFIYLTRCLPAESSGAGARPNFKIFKTIMATQAETAEAVKDCLNRVGQELKISFREFEIETYTGGGYRSGAWTYKVAPRRVALDYWFSSFSSKKEEIDVTYAADEDAAKLENALREGLDKLRAAVKRKKGLF